MPRVSSQGVETGSPGPGNARCPYSSLRTLTPPPFRKAQLCSSVRPGHGPPERGLLVPRTSLQRSSVSPGISVYVASFFLELLCSIQTCNCLESRLDDTAPFSASEGSRRVTRKPPDPHLVGARLRASRRPTLFKNFLKFLTLRVELPVSDLSFSNSLHQLHGTGTTLSFSSTEGRV